MGLPICGGSSVTRVTLCPPNRHCISPVESLAEDGHPGFAALHCAVFPQYNLQSIINWRSYCYCTDQHQIIVLSILHVRSGHPAPIITFPTLCCGTCIGWVRFTSDRQLAPVVPTHGSQSTRTNISPGRHHHTFSYQPVVFFLQYTAACILVVTPTTEETNSAR